MFELDIQKEFSAAHFLKDYNGDCAKLHGHNYLVQVFVQSEELDEIGIALDFKVLKKELDSILGELDHHFLNEHEEFKDKNPTSERLAQYIYRRLVPVVSTKQGVRLSKVRVCESPTSGAAYFEN